MYSLKAMGKKTHHKPAELSSPSAVLLFLLSLFMAIVSGKSTASDTDQVASTMPKLVVQITVDQLRGDLPMRFRERLGEGGFRYLLEQGTHFNNAHYRHANTETAVGHATLVTGADPSRHGIVSNDWFDQKTGKRVYNTEDDRHHLIGKEPKKHQGVSPRNLLSSTIGDELVLSNTGQSRVFSVLGCDGSDHDVRANLWHIANHDYGADVLRNALQNKISLHLTPFFKQKKKGGVGYKWE